MSFSDILVGFARRYSNNSSSWRRRSRPLHVEMLEDRLTPSGASVGGELVIDLNDYAAANDGFINITKIERVGDSVELYWGAPDDPIAVFDLASACRIRVIGGNDDDFLGLEQDPGVELVFEGRGGDNEFALFDKAGGDDSITVDGSLVRFNTQETHLVDVQSIYVSAGNGNDQISVRTVAAGMEVEINGGYGDDDVTIGDGFLDSIAGDVRILDHNGNDTLRILHDNEPPPPNSRFRIPGITHYVVEPDLISFARLYRYPMVQISYVDMEHVAIHAGRGSDRFTIVGAAPQTMYVLDGGDGEDELRGPNAVNHWVVNGDGQGTLNANTDFHRMESLSGGDRHDTFRFEYWGSLSGRLDVGAGVGVDTLDFSAFRSGVTVDLQRNEATGTFARKPMAIIGDVENVFGSAFDDVILGNNRDNILHGNGGDDDLSGGDGHDVLLGHGGNDQLWGDAGRDILVGGFGRDVLRGGAGDDLLLAGATIYDHDAYATVAAQWYAWNAFRAEWTSTRSYADRVSNMEKGGGLTQGRALDAAALLPDSQVDQLWGEEGSDWLLADTWDDASSGSPLGLVQPSWQRTVKFQRSLTSSKVH